MDKRYELFCLADPLFYDSPDSSKVARRYFDAASRQLPPGWTQTTLGEWHVRVPPGDPIPAQGWKIHVSAVQDNAERILANVFDYCVPRCLSFKFLRGPLALYVRNAKYAPRAASGKLVTIYPVDDAACERTLAELDSLIGGEPGPYILSDLRYGDGPLYVRYGAFTDRRCRDSKGDLVHAVEDASGRLVPDLRTPVFTVPDWVTLPRFLAPHLAARGAVTIKDLPYRVDRPLHFSNGGGVYAATDLGTGERVVLKEARPHAGLAADASDAVARLQREHDSLQQLSGLDGMVPGVRGYFEAGDHHFLVLDHIDGAPLNTLFARKHPLLAATPDPGEIADYASWALHICGQVERAIEAIHDRGIVYNDLHLFNIMVRADDSIVLIDFEAAARIEEGRRPPVGNPGFLAPRDRTGFDIDRYSLACLKLAMFMPLTTMFALDRHKAAHIAEVISANFPVPRDFLEGAVRDIAGPRQPSVHGTGDVPAAGSATRPFSEITPDEEGWDRARRTLVRAIQASATLERDDRLFPGDIEQFTSPSGGLCIATGAAGVLYALSAAGAGCLPEHVEWLVKRTAEPLLGSRLGLYDGLIGVACILDSLGQPDTAQRLAEMFLAERWERLGTDLYGGLSGIALALLHLGGTTGEPRLSEAGLRAADIVTRRVQVLGSEPDRRPVGLLRGFAGPGLLLVRMFERTGDSGYLDLAAAAINADLDKCVLNARGALEVDEGWRLMPYLDGGSAGIGLVIDDFLRHRRVATFERAAEAIRTAACSTYYAQPGLLRGRAGMLLYLARDQAPGEAARDPRLAAHIRRLAWHAIGYQGGVAFPGESLFRLSMDLATGTAGVLIGLAAALSATGCDLPFHATTRHQPCGSAWASSHTDSPGGSSVQGSDEELVVPRR